MAHGSSSWLKAPHHYTKKTRMPCAAACSLGSPGAPSCTLGMYTSSWNVIIFSENINNLGKGHHYNRWVTIYMGLRGCMQLGNHPGSLPHARPAAVAIWSKTEFAHTCTCGIHIQMDTKMNQNNAGATWFPQKHWYYYYYIYIHMRKKIRERILVLRSTSPASQWLHWHWPFETAQPCWGDKDWPLDTHSASMGRSEFATRAVRLEKKHPIDQ